MGTVSKEDIVRFRKQIIAVHEQIIAVSGGLQGVRDEGGLDHALYTCLTKMQTKPHDVFRNAAETYQLFAVRHYFNDGNKRTAHMFVKLYLLSLDIHLKAHYQDAIDFIIAIADNKKSVPEIESWLKENSSGIDSLTDYVKEFEDDVEEMKKYMDTQNSN